MSPLTAFCNQLIHFFEELSETFPEERDIRSALDVIRGAKQINPRLILDMFYEHVVKNLRQEIVNEDVDGIIAHARKVIDQQFNEILPALAIFDKHWGSLEDTNKAAIWKYLKVLVILCEKARTKNRV